MATPAFETCGLEEYRDYEDERVFEDIIAVNGLYTLMFSFDKVQINEVAGRCPSRIADLENVENGLILINFNLLDSDLQPAMSIKAKVHDGYVLTTKHAIANRPTSAYFMEYGLGIDSTDPDLREIIKAGRGITRITKEPVLA